MHKRNSGSVALAAVLVLVAFMALVAMTHADSSRSISDVPNRSAYVEDTSIGIGASAEKVDYADLTDFTGGSAGNGAFCVCVQNISTTDLLFKLVPVGTAVTATQQTTPANAAISRVHVISATNDDWVCFNGTKAAGHIWQSKGPATGSARVVIQY
jgi:hypothetical protein